MLHVHHLHGCAPTPLAHYLKALGIMRLVAEQADPEARGWWDGDRFYLASKLTRDEIEGFFLYDYQPTLLVSPWNKGSGFFAENDSSLSSIQNSRSLRFSAFRSGISASRERLEEIARADKEIRAIKEETKKRGMSAKEKKQIKTSESYKSRLREAEKRFKQLKEVDLIPNLRLNWRGPHREWMDAAMVLADDGTPKYPALLGTGGNDGRLDFTNNFMKRLNEIFDLESHNGQPRSAAPAWVRGALWDTAIPGNLSGQPVGQYLPGMAGGANNANGPDSESLVNPLDFLMMLEGAIAFRSSASRRFESLESSHVATPFVVNTCGAAYPSASADDEGARGEQWMPLWSQPSTYRELHQLLAEGRAQIGAKAVREPLDLARAVKRLGVARGIRSFQRYGYIERNGQSNLAVPLGRFDVANRASEHLTCIDDLDSWLRRLRREARDKNAPARLRQVEKRLVDALFTVTAEHSQSPDRWQGVLSQLTEAEAIMRQGTGYEAQSIPPLRPEWVVASNDGTPEFRLALAFALQEGGCGKSGISVDPIRRHWLPLDRDKPWRFATGGTGLDMQPDVVMHGRCGLDDAIALVQRRLVEASQQEGRHLPLNATMPQAFTSIADLTALLIGHVDLDRTLALARSLMALNRKAWRTWAQKHIMERPHGSDWPDDVWLAIRLCTLPWPIRTRSGFELDIGADPALIRRLDAGDAAKAFVIASRRLRTAGVHCTIRSGAAPPDTARLWAAALAFPITKTTARSFLYHLDPSKE